MQKIKVSLVIPVFNEQESISLFLDRVELVFSQTEEIEVEYLFVNDGSDDDTLSVLCHFQNKNKRITVIDLTRNFGKEAALCAGLSQATGDCVIPIDVDLQDPPELILKMIKKWQDGFDIVLAQRINRNSDHFFKRKSAELFYKTQNSISKIKLPKNVGDFRLMDKKVIEAINQMPESNRFMKGIFAWVGFKTTTIEYTREKRVAGKSKFSGWKLWNFALEGITSFSTFPLRIWTYLGLVVALVSFLYGGWVIFKVFVYGIDTPGFASIITAITFLGGLQLIGIGIIGEYLGRTYLEVKKRPIFLIRNIYHKKTI